jgi:hypothetical protein
MHFALVRMEGEELGNLQCLCASRQIVDWE